MAPAGAEVSIIPVMQGDGTIHIDQDQLPDSLPILALRNAVLFPGTVYPITIGREKSIRLIEDAERSNTFIGAVPQNDLAVEDPRKEDLYGYGTVAKIVKTLEMPDGTITAILQGFKRFEVEEVFEYNPYLLGRVRYMDDIVPEEDPKTRMIAESLKEKAAAIIKSSSFVPREAASALRGIDNFEFLVNFRVIKHSCRFFNIIFVSLVFAVLFHNRSHIGVLLTELSPFVHISHNSRISNLV